MCPRRRWRRWRRRGCARHWRGPRALSAPWHRLSCSTVPNNLNPTTNLLYYFVRRSKGYQVTASLVLNWLFYTRAPLTRLASRVTRQPRTRVWWKGPVKTTQAGAFIIKKIAIVFFIFFTISLFEFEETTKKKIYLFTTWDNNIIK